MSRLKIGLLIFICTLCFHKIYYESERLSTYVFRERYSFNNLSRLEYNKALESINDVEVKSEFVTNTKATFLWGWSDTVFTWIYIGYAVAALIMITAIKKADPR